MTESIVETIKTLERKCWRERSAFVDRNGTERVRLRIEPRDWIDGGRTSKGGLYGWLYVDLDELIEISNKALASGSSDVDEIVTTTTIVKTAMSDVSSHWRLTLDNEGPPPKCRMRFFAVDDGAVHFISAMSEAEALGHWAYVLCNDYGKRIDYDQRMANALAEIYGTDEPIVEEMTQEQAMGYKISDDDGLFVPFGTRVVAGYHGCSEW